MYLNKFIFALIGALITLSVAMSYYVSQAWLLLALFFGVFLFQLAFTGFCPLMIVIKKFSKKDTNAGCCTVDGGDAKDKKIETVDPETLKGWLDKNEAILIDVREVEEYEQAHIPNAILVPVGTCSPATLPINPNKKVVFHCKAGLRGNKACDICSQGLPNKVIYNLEGGIDAWKAKGYAVETI